MLDLWQETRRAWRNLCRHPLASTVIVLTLALGTGANLALFGVLRATLLAPLPYDQPSELVNVSWQVAGGQIHPLSPAELDDLRQRADALDGLGAYHPWTFNVGGIEPPERVPGAVITADLFAVLGVAPAIGHGFSADGPEAPTEVLLSHGLWQRRFAADPAVVGRELLLDDAPTTIVGVMPESFRFPVSRRVELWKVAPYDASMPREMRFFLAVGRLGEGVDARAARAQLGLVSDALAAEHPALHEGLSARSEPMHDEVVGDFEGRLTILQAAVAAALLLACFNVAMLHLGRAEERRAELAVRYALGAGRLSVFRLAAIENVLLGLLGGALGIAVAGFGLDLLVRFGPRTIHRLDEAALGLPEIALALTLGVVCGLLAGQIPAMLQGRGALAAALRPGLRSSAGRRLRDALVTVQVAITLTLLVGCGLFLRSLDRLAAVDLGFDPEPLVVSGVALPEAYGDAATLGAFFHDLRRRLEAIPGVTAATTAVSPPLVKGAFRINHGFDVPDQPAGEGDPQRVASIRPVGPGFFELLDVPVRHGRAFTDADDPFAEPVAVVNRAFAELFLGDGARALDRRLAIALDYGAAVGRLPHPEWRIVGVVGDVRQVELESAGGPAIYVSTLQAPWTETRILVRGERDPAVLAREVEATVRAVVPHLPVLAARPLAAVAAERLAPTRFQSGLLGALALLALILAALGLYGLLAHSVSRRSREIGLRMALGADRRNTRWWVLRQALAVVVIGLGLGLVAAWWLGRSIAGLLYGIAATDVPTYVVAIVSLLSIAALAGWLPARRATTVDPAVSLRHD